jgi:hypothetical protein
MDRVRETTYRHTQWKSLGMILLLVLTACGGGGDGSPTGNNTGELSFTLEFQAHTLHQGTDGRDRIAAADDDICVTYSIETIEATLTDSQQTVVAAESWPCSDHKGTLNNIAPGRGYVIVIKGIVGNVPEWTGQVTDIEIKAGQSTQIGKIVMARNGLVWGDHNWGQAVWQ